MKMFEKKLLGFVKGLDVFTLVMIGASIILVFFSVLNMKGVEAFKYSLLITYLIILPISVAIHFIFTLYPLKEEGEGCGEK